ncbi:36086_t:CDS:2, partial [Gigaspora margarita]
IRDNVLTKKLELLLEKVKGHSNERWNNQADFLAKEGTKKIEGIGTNMVNKMQTSAALACSGTLKGIEYNDDITKFNWQLMWSHLKKFTGSRCNSLKRNKRLSFWFKCLTDNLLVFTKLKAKNPGIYKKSKYIVCNEDKKKSFNHLMECTAYQVSWKNIKDVAIEAIWYKLLKEAQKKIDIKGLKSILLSKSLCERLETRRDLTRELYNTHTCEMLHQTSLTNREADACIQISIWKKKNGITIDIKKRKNELNKKKSLPRPSHNNDAHDSPKQQLMNTSR